MIEISSQNQSGQVGVNQQLLSNQAAKSILEVMRKGQMTYRFSNNEQLNFRLQMGANIVSAAHALNQSGAGFATFYKTKCNQAFWDLTSEGGLQQNPNVIPSAALKDIFQNGRMYAFECATGMVILLYKAVLDSIGSEAFNRYFNDLYLWDWEFDEDLGIDWENPEDYFPGDVRYFKNPDVNPLHIEWQGENVIDMGNGLYFGHGIGILPEQAIIAALNKRRRPGAGRSAYLMKDVARPAFSHLSNLAGTRKQRTKEPEKGIYDRFITVTFGDATQVY